MDRIQKIAPKLFRSRYIGPPLSGRWHVYDLVIDLLGDSYICSADGIPGTWQLAPIVPVPPPVISIVDLTPSSTTAADPTYTVIGTNLDLVDYFTAYVDLVGETVALTILLPDPNILQLSGVLALIEGALGSVRPYSFVVRAYKNGVVVATSPAATATVVGHPMDDAQYPFTPGPTTLTIEVDNRLVTYEDAPAGGGLTTIPLVLATPPYETYSFVAWIRKVNLDGSLYFLQVDLNGAQNLRFYNGALSAVAAQVTGLPTVESDPLTLNDTNWHMVAFVRDAGVETHFLYLDGALVGSAIAPGSAVFDNPLPSIAVGVPGPGPSGPMWGTAAFWTRALSGAEVQNLFDTTVFPA